MNFKPGHRSSAPQTALSVCLLASLLTLSSCGGESSTTALKNELPSPVANEINGEVLVPALPGKEPAPAAELESLPVIAVSQRQFADPNVLLNLTGTVTPAAGTTIVTTLWTQVTGPQVRIPSPLQLNNEIIIPDVSVATTLEFRLTAQDSNGKINSATVAILVKPMPTFVKVIGGVFNETDKTAVFTLKLNAANSLPVTFSYNTQDGTAINGSDYALTSGQIIFAAGETSKTISVALLDDALTENDETFSLQVTALDGGTTHHNSGIALIHSGSELVAPQTIVFNNPAPPPLKVDLQYSNPLVAGPGTGAVIYTSSNPLVASVDGNGLVTALLPGTVTITATRAADTAYAAATASYPLQVISPGAAPIVTIDSSGDLSIAKGEILNLTATAVDAEDGQLPDDRLGQTRIWNSNTGSLAYGADLAFSSTSWGLHSLAHSAIDSDGNMGTANIEVFVGNLATQATASGAAATTSCSTAANAINDSNRSTGFDLVCGATSFIYLRWPARITFDFIEIYLTSVAANTNEFTIEAFDNGRETWVKVPYHEQVFASLHYRMLGLDSQGITTNWLRISQTTPETIQEIAIYRAFDGTPAENPSSASASLASSSIASSAATSSSLRSSSVTSSAQASSAIASSTKASSSLANSSKPSSSLASSTKASSAIASSLKASSSVKSSSKASSSKGIILL